MGTTLGIHVANATGEPIRVRYHMDRLHLEDVGFKSSGEASTKPKGTISAEMSFKPDHTMSYINIPKDNFVRLSAQGPVYASIYLIQEYCDADGIRIAKNFFIPIDKSIIVTKGKSIKFRKPFRTIWMDEHGERHDKGGEE
ncbi:hypothetical protein AAFF_G00437620 [Aldrovandia affinis]|uniref:Uncharacterized protein n=1 Tax=Aldrovandia affinis TaxID=143900 RepID=A0AAD7S7M5_9TELE|nr:hypothetical protein AAFF_G00437620 [Aldrovandia affinis]